MTSNFPVVGVVGAGPLARLLVAPAIDMGIDLLFYASSAQDSAAQVADHVIDDIGNLSSLRDFALHCDILTFENDLLPVSVIRMLEAQGAVARPSSTALIFAHERNQLLKWNNESALGESEISVLVACSPHGQGSVWTPSTLSSKEHSLTTTTPAPELSDILSIRAQETALAIADEAGLIGVMGVDFIIREGSIHATSLKMNPSFSGVWTIEGSRTSQFEQHLRAILDLPLGDPTLTNKHVVTGTFSAGTQTNMYRPYLHLMARSPGLKFHQYRVDGPGQSPIGHVTAVGSNLLDLRECVTHAIDYMSGVSDE